ncbi:hypothetical protein Syun_016299 [Stephania yunnanensis]|uniref:Uncharacterized protein n=1 Tax=Stephania yunnanensis TaxID=152371 RepID=A0AAP0J766_9MAGN
MSNADLLFGGVTIVCGIPGTLSGGYVLDFMNSTISNAFKVAEFNVQAAQQGTVENA